jgi:hypothetical protein
MKKEKNVNLEQYEARISFLKSLPNETFLWGRETIPSGRLGVADVSGKWNVYMKLDDGLYQSQGGGPVPFNVITEWRIIPEPIEGCE